MSTLRLLKYYSLEGQTIEPNYFRAGAHADFDILTLLFQKPGQDGLELCPGRSISTDFGYGDQWTPITITEGAIVCNIGDQAMRWSDDRLKSTFHRVSIGDYLGDRYSIGFFNQARKSANMQGPKKAYPPIVSRVAASPPPAFADILTRTDRSRVHFSSHDCRSQPYSYSSPA